MTAVDRGAAGPSRGFHGGLRQSMAWLHTWVGLLLAAVLYFVFVTGSFGYFHAEIDRWMRPEMPPAPAQLPAPEVMAMQALAYLEQHAPDAVSWGVDLAAGRHTQFTRLYVSPGPSGAMPPVDLLDPRDGTPFAGVRATGGGRALYEMHYALRYIDYDAATYLVGAATLFMLVALVTGVIVHKKIFTDYFTFRPGRGPRNWQDGHNVVSVMALPFLFVITLSGVVFFTFKYSPVVSWATYFAGPAAAARVAEDFVPFHPAPAGQRVPMSEVSGPLREAAAAWGAGQVGSLTVSNPGDARAQLRIDRHQGLLFSRRSETWLYDATTGQRHAVVWPFLSTSDAVVARAGEEPSADIWFADLLMTLHEGHFASPLVRWLYFGSGLLGAAMVATGSVLWANKRRQRAARHGAGRCLVLVERLNVGVIAGLPLAVASYFAANRLLPVDLPGRADGEIHTLFLVWATALLHALFSPPARAWREQFAAVAASCAALPVINGLTTEKHLGRSLLAGDWVLAGFDLTALAMAVAFAAAARQAGRP